MSGAPRQKLGGNAGHVALEAGRTLVVEGSGDGLRVVAGAADAYLAPLEGGLPGQRRLVGSVAAGDFVPALDYRDLDGRLWRVVLVARSAVDLVWEQSPDLPAVQDAFLQLGGIGRASGQAFASALVDWYRAGALKDQVYIIKSDEDRAWAAREASRLSERALALEDRELSGRAPSALKLVELVRERVTAGDRAVACGLSLAEGTLLALFGLFAQRSFDQFIASGDASALVWIGMLVFVCLAGGVALAALRARHAGQLQARAAGELRGELVAKLFEAPLAFSRGVGAAGMVGRAALAADIVSAAIGASETGVSAICRALPALAFLATLDPVAALVVGAYGLCCAGAAFGASQRGLRYRAEARPYRTRAGALMRQLVEGIATMRAAGSEQRALVEYLGQFLEMRSRDAKGERFGALSLAAPVAIAGCALGALAALGLGLQALTPGGFAAAAVLAAMTCGAGAAAGRALATLRDLGARFDEVGELARMPEPSSGGKVLWAIDGAIELEHVTFSYEADGPPTVYDVSLSILPGESVGIVGPSGSGKSTLVSLILGLEEPDAGEVRIDGHPLATLDLGVLRRSIGAVLQGEQLMTGTIYENIAAVNPHIGPQEAWDALAAAGFAADVARMPMNLGTLVGERGSALSVGQQQRVLVARALARKPRILLFDEATSALDATAQKAVVEALGVLDCTKVVVAHRLSTVADCDRIVKMEAGRIVWEGTPAELAGQDFEKAL